MVDVGPYARLGLSAFGISSLYLIWMKTRPKPAIAEGQDPTNPYVVSREGMTRGAVNATARIQVGTAMTTTHIFSEPFPRNHMIPVNTYN